MNQNDYDISQIDAETQEMLRSFVSEAFDSLDTNEPIVEDLRNADNGESVNAIFRVFHTLKGLSGFFEMNVIRKVTHEAETLLDIIRKNNKKQSDATLTIIYQTFDFLRDLLTRVNTELTDRSGEEEADDMILILKDSIENAKNPELSLISDNSTDFIDLEGISAIEDGNAFQSDQNKETENINENSASASADEDSLISDDMLDQYITSSNELLDLAERNILVLEKNPDNFGVIRETFGAVHSLKGNSGFMGFSEIEDISVDMETILDCIRNSELVIDQNIATILLSNIETIRKRFESIQNEVNKKVSLEQTDIGQSNSEHAQITHEIKPAASSKSEPHAINPKIEISKEIAVHSEEDSSVAKMALTAIDPDSETESAVTKTSSAQTANKAPSVPSMQRKDIRVETIKIDKLFDLVGELITIETMVTKNPDLIGLQLPNFSKSANMLNKITRELQEISMSIRMMPLEGLFNKMKRLVRDVSIKMKKKVNLVISGQDTEMDKNVIDEISDPLVHILRNSIDHGVELPMIRAEKGKSETGNVWLSARYEGNEILIIVQDDGAGMDKHKLLKKAEEKGILTVAADKMSDKEIYGLIFEPGFSTAEKVTDISGRGVGMDVVRKNIEKLRGAVTVMSELGKGSTITLRIPLTLAIMEAMIIRVGKDQFALPILSLKESFRVNRKNINVTMDGLEVVKVRNEIIPIIRLYELFNKEPENTDLEKGILIIIELRDKQFCLFADEIVGQQQAVIKSLGDYIGKVPGVMGCMILGDGGIGLILDIESLMDMAEKPLV
ncbi:MAG: chemotaxis protein CheA [Candidatus Kapabacteria bacterium]|nr:chemotaxis protein CheA [Candidatus Kapabacteria bacterium]